MQQIPPQQEVRSRVSKETRVTNRHRHSDVSAVLRKSKQTSQVQQSIFRTCRQTDNSSAISAPAKDEGGGRVADDA